MKHTWNGLNIPKGYLETVYHIESTDIKMANIDQNSNLQSTYTTH